MPRAPRPRRLGSLPWLVGLALVACGPRVGRLDVEPELVVFDPAGTTLAVTVRDDRGNVLPNVAVRWHSSDARVAEVDETGAQRRADGAMVYRVQVGDSGLAWLTAKAGTQIADVRIRVAIPKSVEVTPLAVKLPGVGQSLRLQVLVRDEHAQALSGAPVWVRSLGAGGAPPVFTAELTDGGVQVTALALGHGALMVYSGTAAPLDGGADPKGSFWTPVAVDVVPAAPLAPPPPARVPEASLVILPSALTLKVGRGAELKVRLGEGLPKGRVAWKSLAPKILSVSPKGKLKAKKRGRAEVTATVGRLIARALVTVK